MNEENQDLRTQRVVIPWWVQAEIVRRDQVLQTELGVRDQMIAQARKRHQRAQGRQAGTRHCRQQRGRDLRKGRKHPMAFKPMPQFDRTTEHCLESACTGAEILRCHGQLRTSGTSI